MKLPACYSGLSVMVIAWMTVLPGISVDVSPDCLSLSPLIINPAPVSGWLAAWSPTARQDAEARKTSSDSDELPSAETIVDKYIRALGGYEILGSRSNVHYKMKAIKSNMPFEYEVYAADGLYYSCYHYENGRVFERGVNHGIAWTRTNGVLRQCSGDELKGLVQRHRYISPAPRWFEIYKSIECQSIETINGHETYKLHFVADDGSVVDRYFDTETGYLIRSAADEVYNTGKRHIIRDYSDHQPRGESVIAQRRSSNSAGTVYRYEVESFEFDVKIPKGTFDLPPAITARIARAKKDESKPRSDVDK